MESCTETQDGKVIIIRQKPSRPSRPQTLIDQDNCIERRRAHATTYDKMRQFLTQITGGKLTKAVLMSLAKRIAEQKGIKIDRGAKRLKDCLICWFCEHASELLVDLVAPHAKTESSLPFFKMEIDDFDFPRPSSRDEDMDSLFERDPFA
jgi:hypothetical protein